MLEIDQLNKVLDKGQYTFDYHGNILFASTVPGDTLPPTDFKFRYRFKRAKRIGGYPNQQQ